MIPVQFDYAAPASLEEAVKLLKNDERAQILAGSHSLIASLKQGRACPPLLIDLLKIPSLSGIRCEANGLLQIDAMTTLDQVAASREVQENFPALAEAAHSVGDAQIRNWQRTGDLFAYRDLACDLPAVALVLEATFQTVGVSGHHAMGAEELLRLAVESQWILQEIVSSIDFPPCVSWTGTAYQSLRHPASALAICGVAALVEPSANQVSVSKCRVAVTGALSYPIRLPQVEAAMEGKAPTAENIAAAAKLAAENVTTAVAAREELTILGDLYASAEYRTHLSIVLTKRTLTEATKRAKFAS